MILCTRRPLSLAPLQLLKPDSPKPKQPLLLHLLGAFRVSSQQRPNPNGTYFVAQSWP